MRNFNINIYNNLDDNVKFNYLIQINNNDEFYINFKPNKYYTIEMNFQSENNKINDNEELTKIIYNNLLKIQDLKIYDVDCNEYNNLMCSNSLLIKYKSKNIFKIVEDLIKVMFYKYDYIAYNNDKENQIQRFYNGIKMDNINYELGNNEKSLIVFWILKDC